MTAITNGGQTVKDYLLVSGVARRLGVAPRAISDLFYSRRLNDELCPIIGGRRLIPLAYLGQIEAALRDRGRLPRAAASTEAAR
jgi:hypothetical protein